MSKGVFAKSVLDCIKDKELKRKLKKIMEIPLIPAKINKIIKSNKKRELVDISVSKHNFIANGLIVHNSAHRFERLREESTQDFFKRTSEKINSTFEEYGENLKGVIVGGPGITKNKGKKQKLRELINGRELLKSEKELEITKEIRLLAKTGQKDY